VWRPLRPLVSRESALTVDRGCHGVLGASKRDEEGVALRVDLAPVVGGERLAQDPLVLLERLAVPLAELLQQPSRALDVGEEEGDGADRKLVDRAHGQVLPPSGGVS
jgi:hypothetical protein